MEKDKNVVDEFLDELKGEVEPFKGEVTDEEPKEEKPIAFHKDPKVQRYIQKELDKRLANIKPTESENFIKETASEEADDLTSAMERIIGNDTPEKVHALKMLKTTITKSEERAIERAMEAFQAQTRQEREAEEQATEELTSGFEEIEEEFGIDLTSNSVSARKVRNDFVDFIKLVAPKDENGEVTDYPDLPKTFEVFQKMRKSDTQPTRAKELASRSMARSSEVSTGFQKGGPKTFEEFERWINK